MEPVGELADALPDGSHQDFLKGRPRPADDTHMTDIDVSMRHVIDHVVDHVPGVLGVLVGSVDGRVLASRITRNTGFDTASIAAMSAAVLGLSNRLVQLTGDAPASFSHQRSNDGQVFVFGISTIAVLTVLTDSTAAPAQIQLVGQDVGRGLERMFRSAANA